MGTYFDNISLLRPSNQFASEHANPRIFIHMNISRSNFIKDTGLLAILFSFAFALFLPQSLAGIGIFDEGFIMSGSMLTLDGGLPYRDYYSAYGPGQYYLNALLFALFNEELIVVRIAHSALLASLAIVVFLHARDLSARNLNLSLIIFFAYLSIVLFAKPNAGYPAITAVLLLLLSVRTLGKWIEEPTTWLLLVSSGLVGVAALFRWDFGVFGLVALTLTVVLHQWQAGISNVRAIRVSLLALYPALSVAIAVYGPLLLVFSSPVLWFQEVFLYFLGYSEWRNVELIRPAYWGLMTALQEGGGVDLLYRSILRLAYGFLPAMLCICTLGIVGHSLVRGDRDRMGSRITIQAFFIAVLSAELLLQMRVRPTPWQGFPALITSLPLIAYLLGALKQRIDSNPLLQALIKVSGFLAGSILLHSAIQGFIVSVDHRLINLNTPRASNIRVKPEMASYEELVNYVRKNTHPDEVIYSGVMDHTRLFINDAMLYFLTDRTPAVRFLDLEPGVANTESGQKEIIDALNEHIVRLIVLLDITSDEPNLTSQSNGVYALDQYISKNYQAVEVFGRYTVFIRKPS
jgi:hypothetical protein